jgi:hypothetical protein
MASAQEMFKAMLRDEVAPALRSMGFKGSGQNFALPSDSHWALLGFQRSQSNDRSRVSFTVNVVVVPRDVWERGSRAAWPDLGEGLRNRPTANAALSPKVEPAFEGRFWHRRIGVLMPAGRDTWWEIDADSDVPRLAGEVVASIRGYALPTMRERLGYPSTNAP